MSGKYSSRMAEYFDTRGDADEETGDVDTIGHYQLFRFTDEDREEYVAKNGKEIAADLVGCIVYTDSQGFVDAWVYSDAGQLTRDWATLQGAYASALDDDEE